MNYFINTSHDFTTREDMNSTGAYHSTQNFESFETGKNGTETSWEKFQRIRKLLNFRKANHSTETYGNFGIKVKWNGNYQEKNRKFGYASRGCPLFRNLCKFLIFYSVLASSFGHDHSELDISRKDDGDAHLIKETLKNFSTYVSINTSYS